MRRLAAANSIIAIAASLAPALAAAQDARGSAGQELELAPVLLGLGAVVLLVVLFTALRAALLRAVEEQTAER